MMLVSRTYWAGLPFWFRRPPEHAAVESLALRAHDLRQLRAHYWTSTAHPPPRVGVVVMHPRVDFSHHYAIPRLLGAGLGVLAANTRHAGNDTMAEHEEMVLDLGACVRYLREQRGVETVVLLGNCGGASLAAYYQAQAALPPGARIARSPGGAPTHFEGAALAPADAIIYVAPHRGQGKILMDAIDPSVVDERDPLAADPALDMYDPCNGFREPPAWSEYGEAFLARYRAAQRARVARLDEVARAMLARIAGASAEAAAPGFAERPEPERRDVMRRRACEPVMVVYRTNANPAYVDRNIGERSEPERGGDPAGAPVGRGRSPRGIAPSGRDYGSLLSERPDLMNYAALGIGRTCTPRAWLSTWSGLSSNADLVANVARITAPTLLVHAGRDREIFPADIEAIADAMAAPDRRVVTIEGARHYFEPEVGEREAPHVEALMDVVVPWIQERLA
jgi:dienelactone hydrolase